MDSSIEPIVGSSFSFLEKAFFYFLIIIACSIGISYLYSPNFIRNFLYCEDSCIIDNLLWDLYGISDINDGIMKQATDSLQLWSYNGKGEADFLLSGSDQSKNISYVVRIQVDDYILPSITITNDTEWNVVSYLIMKNFVDAKNLYRKLESPLLTKPVILWSWSCSVISSLDTLFTNSVGSSCGTSKYTQENILFDEQSELYLFFITRYNGKVRISYK